MFAGPNGSGKSTIKAKVAIEFPRIFGIYVNPDDIESGIRETGRFNFGKFKIKTTEDEVIPYLKAAGQIVKAGAEGEVDKLRFAKNSLIFRDVEVNSYFVSAIADFIHEKLVDAGRGFTLETVMSHENKITLLRRAQDAGFRTYLYYVATEEPEINLERVQIRVSEGGHNVAPGKVEERYPKSLNNLLGAIAASDRAYIFDNSGKDSNLFAEVTDGVDLKFQASEVPIWFEKWVLDKAGIVLPKAK
jgi:predicted ABC-type ATPase